MISRDLCFGGIGVLEIALGLAALVGVDGCLAAASAQEELFVTNATPSVTVYVRTASGDTAPLRTLQGPATGLSSPVGIAVDPLHDELVVVNGTPFPSIPSITVYARTASGDTTPLRTLQGPATGLTNPQGLALDMVANELVVANRSPDSVTVYARTASGNTPPLRTLAGGLTGLNGPVGLAVDTVNNELLVANAAANSITSYARTASGDTAPLRTLQGPATGLSIPFGLAVDTLHSEMVVANAISSVRVYARTASGDTAPLRTLQGPATGLSSPIGIAVDPLHNELVVVNGNPFPFIPSVTVYARTASGDTAPLRTLQGPATGLIEPEFIAVTIGVEAPGIPAVSEWALIPLVALLALAMIWAFRRHAH